MAVKSNLLNPSKSESGKINVRVHKLVERIFNRIFSEHHVSDEHKYSKGKIIAMALLNLDKSMKAKKVKRGDDIAKKLGLQITEQD